MLQWHCLHLETPGDFEVATTQIDNVGTRIRFFVLDDTHRSTRHAWLNDEKKLTIASKLSTKITLTSVKSAQWKNI